MLTTLLALFSTSGIGAVVGLVGGFANRWMDQRSKAADQAFELAKMDKDREYMKDEIAAKLTITQEETAGATEVAGYAAMSHSYDFAATTKEDGIVDKFSKFVRPFLTLAFFFFTMFVFYKISLLVEALSLKPTPEEVWKLYVYTVQWIFFQSGTAIGWWFAMRPGKAPAFTK